MRTFQYSDAKSHKFWNITVSGTSFTVTYGKVGTAGQSSTKTFDTPEKAQAEADKLIKEKTGKGYAETTPKAVVPQGEALEQGVITYPHDLVRWAAYSDYLAEQGDPRGEFMNIQLALEDENMSADQRKALKKQEADLLEKHEKEWVGEWPEYYVAPTQTEGRGQINHTGGKKYEFQRGVLATANFGELTVTAAREFVKAPQSRFVRELFVGDYAFDDEFEPGPDIPEDVETDNPSELVLLRWPHMKNVRRFQFGWQSDEVYDNFCNFQCHLGGEHVFDYVKQMPDIEELYIFAHVRDAKKIVALPMPNLRVFQLYHGWSYPLDRLAKNASLGKLTHLLCHPHALDDDEAYIRLPDLRAVCRSTILTSLTHLRLRLADFGDKGIQEIVDSGILKRLKLLDLRHGCVTDEGARRLAACPDVKNLERLDLSRNRLTAAGMDTIRATGVPCDFEHQHVLAENADAYEQRQYLYEADYE